MFRIVTQQYKPGTNSSSILGRKYSTESTKGSGFQYIKVSEKKAHSVVVTLDRTEMHNAFNEVLIEEITQAFKNIPTSHPSARSVILTGSGASFSAGADLNWMKKMVNYTREENERDSRQLFDMVHSIRNCPLPVIGKVNGNAFGGGAGLVAACDMSFALNTAKFGFTEVKLGLVPAVISPFVMEKIGKSNCSRFFLTGERFGPEEAKRIGLIQDHFATETELDAIIDKLTSEIAASGPKAVKICKELIQSVAKMDMHDPATKTYVTSVIAKVRISEEGQSGLNAFLNKGKPMWQK